MFQSHSDDTKGSTPIRQLKGANFPDSQMEWIREGAGLHT